MELLEGVEDKDDVLVVEGVLESDNVDVVERLGVAVIVLVSVLDEDAEGDAEGHIGISLG